MQEQKGTLSSNFLEDGESLIHGNELLAEIYEDYPAKKFYQLKEYKLTAVVKVIKAIDEALQTQYIKNFIGYIVFDCLIANQDRHHENWAFIIDNKASFKLAPSYDHAAGFGCRETDENIEKRLTTKDKNYSVIAYSQKARTPFHSAKEMKKISTIDACRHFIESDAEHLCYWLEKVQSLKEADMQEILLRVPNSLISDNQRKFALALVNANINRLSELKKEVCKNVS